MCIRDRTYPHQQAEHRYTPFIASVKPSETTVRAGEIDWAALRQQGEEQGKSLCTNNSFYMEDGYYQDLIRARGYTCLLYTSYVASIIVLALTIKGATGPAASGKPYSKISGTR